MMMNKLLLCLTFVLASNALAQKGIQYDFTAISGSNTLYFKLDASQTAVSVVRQNAKSPYYLNKPTRILEIPETVVDPNSTVSYPVTSIGDSAFYDCDDLATVTIGNNVTSIGKYAFSGSGGFYRLTIGENVTSIGAYAFQHCDALTGDLVLPNSVTSIGDNAFEYCRGLTGNLVIPNSVTTIGENAFYYCDFISVTIPSSVESIGAHAFQFCSDLTTITIGENVTSIGDYAFQYCSELTTVFAKWEDPAACLVDASIFSGDLAYKTLAVPNGTEAYYRSAPLWKEFGSIIPFYTISYVGIDANMLSSNPEVYTSETADFTLNIPIKDGYTFTGWTSPRLSYKAILVNISMGSEGAIEFTANWIPNIVGSVSINNISPKIGDTLTVTIDITTPIIDGIFTYQWCLNGVAIDGATAETYVVIATDAPDNKKITVVVTAKDHGLSLTSEATGSVTAIKVINTPTYEVSQMVISPNPVSRSAGEVTIYFPQNIIGTGSCTIYDAQGNRIDHQDVNLARGTAIRWDLCNESGRRVASGGYLAILQITDSMGMVHFC